MPGTMQALLENVAAIGASTTGRLIEIGLARPPEAVRLAMAVGQGARLHRSRHLRLRQDEPIGLITTWLPRSIGRGISAADVERSPMLALLEQRGVKVAWATQSIAAVLADAEVAGHLGIAAGQPLVHLQRLVHDEQDRPVEQLSALYRADRYEYRSLLRRDSRSPLAWSLT
jgi:GntR family transcriptional regulator